MKVTTRSPDAFRTPLHPYRKIDSRSWIVSVSTMRLAQVWGWLNAVVTLRDEAKFNDD